MCRTSPDRPGAGLYIPDNPLVAELLNDAPRHGFRPDHAAYMLHSIEAKRLTDDVDDAGFVHLDARILRGWIQPRAFRSMKEHMVSAGVLATSPYSKGRFSTGFKIDNPFTGPPRRHVVEYLPLAQKLLDFRRRHKHKDNDDAPEMCGIFERRRALLDHQRDALAALTIPTDPEALVATTPEANPGHVLFIGQSIAHHDHDGLTMDAFGWRAHSIMTRTSKHLRPRLLLAGRPVAEVDVANSQPLLLAILLAASSPDNAQHIEAMHNIMVVASPGDAGVSCSWGMPSDFFSSQLVESELCSFREACEGGNLYQMLADDCGEAYDRAKKSIFRDILFGEVRFMRGKVVDAFGRRWPSLLAWIRAAKQKHGYTIIAKALQRMESVIVLDCIGGRLLREFPGMPFLTIHDSALLVADQAEAVKNIMVEEFSRWGVRATVRVK